MATLLLSGLGTIAGGLFGPIGAMAGRAAGALAGGLIDQGLSSTKTTVREGPRLKELQVQSSAEGTPIPRIYGRVRMAGQIIWATDFEEIATTNTLRTPNGKGAPKTPKTVQVSYSYYANLAIAVCEGEINHIGRIWADGQEIDQTELTIRVYKGTEDQPVDPLISATEGLDQTPAYKGIAYVVFEHLALEPFGNRIPQFNFEVIRSVGKLEQNIKAICLIPGASEYGLDTEPVNQTISTGVTTTENQHVFTHTTNLEASIDELCALCPNLETISIILTWFGDDLRASHCTIRPKVEYQNKTTSKPWRVSGLERSNAEEVSRIDNRPAFGGSPNDASVLNAIAHIKARGKKVVLYPFIQMDIPSDNTRANPYAPETTQPAHPWRGQITASLAPEQTGTPNKTAAMNAEIDTFFGAVTPNDFTPSGSTVTCAGTEWSFRRMILHYAHLSTLAGGVDGFILCSELKGLTQLRDHTNIFPAVSHLITLANDVRTIVGQTTQITYGADWTEYGGFVPHDETESLFFPLDPLWATPNIDMIGIDWYPPLSDWRNTKQHLDQNLTSDGHDFKYLRNNCEASEAYSWYYANENDKKNQIRTPIADTIHNTPWVYRQKDLKNWWSNPHIPRLNGALQQPTAFTPSSKPVWLLETGCGAINLGANAPYSFVDDKSSIGTRPPFSDGGRDDAIQRTYLNAQHAHWTDNSDGRLDQRNPKMANGTRMISDNHIFPWAWDARPYPHFPLDLDLWSDGYNWEKGHWLNGRLGSAGLVSELTEKIAEDYKIQLTSQIISEHVFTGFVDDNPSSARTTLSSLSNAIPFIATNIQNEPTLISQTGIPTTLQITEDHIIRLTDDALWKKDRNALTSRPTLTQVTLYDEFANFEPVNAQSRNTQEEHPKVAKLSLPIVSDRSGALALSETMLLQSKQNAITYEFSLPLSYLGLTPGDTITVSFNGRLEQVTIERITISDHLNITAKSTPSPTHITRLTALQKRASQSKTTYGTPQICYAELPNITSETPAQNALVFGAFAAPWPAYISTQKSVESIQKDTAPIITSPMTFGTLATTLTPSQTHQIDYTTEITLTMGYGALYTITRAELLDGANTLILTHPEKQPEVIQFQNAELISPQTYKLSLLIRGQLASETAAQTSWPAGTLATLYNQALALDPLPPHTELKAHTYSFYPNTIPTDLNKTTLNVQPKGFSHPAVTHIKAIRHPEYISINFIPRNVKDSFLWSGDIFAINDTQESYIITIWNNDAIIRTITSPKPEINYLSTEELQDFGSLQTELTLSIAQISSTAHTPTPEPKTHQIRTAL